MRCHRGLALVFTALLAVGCTGELVIDGPTGGGTGDGTGGGNGDGTGGGNGAGVDAGGGGTTNAAKQEFDANVAPLFSVARPKGTCKGCHQGVGPVGPAFLGQSDADMYNAVTTFGVINAANPTGSLLITTGDHEGNAFCTGAGTPYAQCTTDEVTLVTNWISQEN